MAKWRVREDAGGKDTRDEHGRSLGRLEQDDHVKNGLRTLKIADVRHKRRWT